MHDEHSVISDIRNIADALIQAGLPVKRRWHAPDNTGPATHQCDDPNHFIDASQTVLELGHPTSASIFLGVLTDKDGLIENNRITRLGTPLSELPPGRHALALILFAKTHEINEHVQRDLNKHVLSCNRLGGVMARMTSGRIWLRISREALTNGVTLDSVGRHILKQMHADPGRYESAEVMVVVGSRNHVEHLRPVAEKQAQARSDRYQSALVEKMACETGLDCDQCPETETCKVLRKAVAAARKKDEG